jgi:hypothetical protein
MRATDRKPADWNANRKSKQRITTQKKPPTTVVKPAFLVNESALCGAPDQELRATPPTSTIPGLDQACF